MLAHLKQIEFCAMYSCTMDFGKIFEQWLEAHDTVDKDALAQPSPEEERAASISAYMRFKRMRPQAEIDLHGMHEAEARQAVQSFLARCAAQGLEKASIIHGKGNHSREEQVLVHVVREELEQNPHAGEFCFADGQNGGRGVTWVRIRPLSISRGK
jgi:DNA-nicking Smr family endonuclease